MNRQEIDQLAHDVLGYVKGEMLQPLEKDHLAVAIRILEKAFVQSDAEIRRQSEADLAASREREARLEHALLASLPYICNDQCYKLAEDALAQSKKETGNER